MNVIVAVDRKWGIGYDNKLLFDIPEDMKFFKDMTDGKIVVMGYNTLLSLPGGKPLKNRTNIVICDNKDFKQDGATLCYSIEEALDKLREYDPNDVFVMGGQGIYEQLLGYCKTAYITKVESVEKADRHFPNIDDLDNWELISQSGQKEYNGLKYTFCKFRNNNA